MTKDVLSALGFTVTTAEGYIMLGSNLSSSNLQAATLRTAAAMANHLNTFLFIVIFFNSHLLNDNYTLFLHE